jgi:outer membrane protein TolC
LKQSLVQITGLAEEAVIEALPDGIPALPDLRDVLHALSGGAGGAGGGAAAPSAHLLNLADETRVARLNFEIAKKRLYPSLGVSLSVNQENRSQNYASDGPRYLITTWGAYATVNWTLFDGLATQAAKRSALERMKAAEAGRSLAQRQEGAERRAEVARLLVQWEQLQNAERDLARARGGMEIVEMDFKNGTASARNAEDARMHYLAALQSPHGGAHAARANFYIALVSCLSNRGQDPVIMAMER